MRDIEHLIRSAKPSVDSSGAERVVEQVASGFARPAVPAPWLRIAAALIVACCAGFAVSGWFARPEPVDPRIAAVEQKIAELDRRLAETTAGPTAAQLAELNRRADNLIGRPALPLDKAIARSVEEVSVARAKARMERQREAHLVYAHKRYEKEVNDAVARLKKDYDLSPGKEAELRAVFAEHGTQVQQLITRNYGGKTRSLRGEFATIKRDTDTRVQNVLSEVPLHMPGGDLAEWGPNPDYETLSDLESIQRWREEAQQPG